MFMFKSSEHSLIQWKLQKKFKTNFFKKYIILNNPYKKYLILNYIYKKLILFLTKINSLTKSVVKIDYLTCRILKVKKKKLSLIIEELFNKFVININLKAFNFII